MQYTETRVLSILHGNAAALNVAGSTAVPPYVSHLKEFLLRTQAVVLAQAGSQPSVGSPVYTFAVNYLRQLLGDASGVWLC